MKVLIDATAVPPNRGGVGRYVDELVPALVRQGVRPVLTCQRRDVEHFEEIAPGVKLIPVSARLESQPIRLAWEQTVLPLLLDRISPDVLHSPHYTQPVAAGMTARDTALVVTLHDATFFTSPELHSKFKGVFFREATRRAVRRADALVTPSKATRDEVIRLIGGDEDLFHVAYHGVDASWFHPTDRAEQQRVALSLGLGDSPYIAFLGTLEPRKNVPALVRGWVTAVTAMTNPPALVLAGAPGWDENVDAAIAAVPSHLTVIRTGYLPLGDLAGFLGGARLVVYPSLGEGFGLPVLEAMASGSAVLTTRRLSLPEVGGDAVAYCGVADHDIAQGIDELLAADERRQTLGQEAVKRAAAFTWDAAALAHITAYEAAIEHRLGNHIHQ